MTDSTVFIQAPSRLPLVTDHGRGWLGLKRSSSPELIRRVQSLFEHLNTLRGFADTAQGQKYQDVFNHVLRYTYPEIMIDLADMIYAQHERPMVFLHFDHINANLKQDPGKTCADSPLEPLNRQMEFLIRELARTIRMQSGLHSDREIVRLLGESYAHYIYETKNFPWEEPLDKSGVANDHPILDVATGLAGFSLIHDWPENHPTLILSDKTHFIVESLSCYKNLVGRRNVEIMESDFPGDVEESTTPMETFFGSIWANKFLHHLQREDREKFLRWALSRLIPNGVLSIVDTDLEYQILQQAKDPAFREKLIPGYLDTLDEVEKDFCKNLMEDITAAGFKLTGFDYHEYLDETDAFSQYPEDTLSLKFIGMEILAEKPNH